MVVVVVVAVAFDLANLPVSEVAFRLSTCRTQNAVSANLMDIKINLLRIAIIDHALNRQRRGEQIVLFSYADCPF